MSNLDDELYKQQKIAFVSNLSGSSKEELLLVLSVIPASILFHRVLSHSLYNKFPFLHHRREEHRFIEFIYDFIILVLPLTVSMTFTQYTSLIIFLMVVSSIIIWSLSSKSVNYPSPSSMFVLSSPRKPFIDEYRAYMMLTTCIVILAVDFVVFPRRFAKTETYGISLMDMGVGSVVLSGALVSKQARIGMNQLKSKITAALSFSPKLKGSPSLIHSSKKEGSAYRDSPRPFARNKHVVSPREFRISSEKSVGKQYDRRTFVLSAVRSTAPLFLLGLARLVLTKSTNYHEHVSEYGVHWNFFFTLFAVSVIVALVNLPHWHSAILGVTILVIYQLVLSLLGLEDFVINGPRIDLISANKEGLSSVFSYTSIYLIGVTIGAIVFTKRISIREWKRLAGMMFAAAVIATAITLTSEHYNVLISRRLANLPYAVMILGYNLYLLALFLAISIFTWPVPSMLLSAINRNQLFIFLLANLLTGAVNFTVRTIFSTDIVAFSIVIVYAFSLCLIAVILDMFDINLKFW